MAEAAVLPGVDARPDAPVARRVGRPGLRVVVMASDLLMARGLGTLLEGSSTVQTDYVGSVQEAGERLTETPAHVVLWFTDHADANSLGELSALRQTHGVALCIAAQSVDFCALRDAYRARAEGLAVLLRRTRLDVADLSRVIVQLVTGRVVLSPAILEQLVIDSRAASEHVLCRLTSYELAVLELMALGLRNCAIAARLGRSEKLVEKHVGRIFSKLGLDLGAHPDVDRRVRAARMFLFASSDGALNSPSPVPEADAEPPQVVMGRA